MDEYDDEILVQYKGQDYYFSREEIEELDTRYWQEADHTETFEEYLERIDAYSYYFN